MRNYIHLAQPSFDKSEEKEVIESFRLGWVTLVAGTKEFKGKFGKMGGL